MTPWTTCNVGEGPHNACLGSALWAALRSQPGVEEVLYGGDHCVPLPMSVEWVIKSSDFLYMDRALALAHSQGSTCSVPQEFESVVAFGKKGKYRRVHLL